MDQANAPLRVGDAVPDFEIKTYDPSTHGFGTFHLATQTSEGKWSILFFYPADFTFVCPTELGDLADHYEDLRSMGV